MDIPNRPLRVLGETCGRIDLGWIGDIDQMMRNAPPLFERELVGADIEPPVDGGGIAIDDLAVEQRGKRQAEGALPARRRSQDGKDSCWSQNRDLRERH
jgi:hypothetical protein